VTFVTPDGSLVQGINGDEIVLQGFGTTNIATRTDIPGGVLSGTPTLVSGNTWRYGIGVISGKQPTEAFAAGEVKDFFLPNTFYTVDKNGHQTPNEASTEVFTVQAAPTGATAKEGIKLGPVTLQGPTVTIAKLGFQNGQLVVTIGIGADLAELGFGGTAGTTGQTSSGITAKLTGLLCNFH